MQEHAAWIHADDVFSGGKAHSESSQLRPHPGDADLQHTPDGGSTSAAATMQDNHNPAMQVTDTSLCIKPAQASLDVCIKNTSTHLMVAPLVQLQQPRQLTAGPSGLLATPVPEEAAAAWLTWPAAAAAWGSTPTACISMQDGAGTTRVSRCLGFGFGISRCSMGKYPHRLHTGWCRHDTGLKASQISMPQV
jgi:hypothetical protein